MTRRIPFAVVFLALAVGASFAGQADPAAAGEQFRLARRLAAENAAGADDALEKVVDLDPKGPFADDALIERALLRGVARRPDALGRIAAVDAEEARPWLQQAAALAGADRATEARYLLSLSLLEPLPGRDAEAARRGLLAVTTAEPASDWAARARFAVGWLDRTEGDLSRARGAWLRVVLDAPRSDAAVWSRGGLAGVELELARPGEAASWAQETLDAEPRDVRPATALRAAAIRDLARSASPDLGWAAWPRRTLASPGRSVSALARHPDGSLFVADRREGMVRRFDAAGRVEEQWTLDDVTALAVDPFGRLLAAAGERLFLLERGSARALGDLGRFSQASVLAPGVSGAIFLLDRKGDRIGALAPGAAAVTALREDRGTRLAALAAVAGRLVGAAAREGRLLRVSTAGLESPVAGLPLESVASMCVDASGRFTLLDDRSGIVLLVTGDGTVADRFDARAAGIEKPTAITCGADGSFDLYDASTGQIWRIGE